MKVCLTSRDSNLLRRLLSNIAEDEECYWVKMSTTARDGMFLGRCFFTTRERAGQVWAKYKSHPRLMVTIQDDDFVASYRAQVTSWVGKPEDSIE
jgi:hypothetical protein